MTTTPNATRRGARRQAAFLKAATAVFLAKGYGAATLDDVVRVSGGSRATLYKQFGDKAGLFAAIIAELSAAMTAPLDGPLRGDPRAALAGFGRAFMRIMTTRSSLALYRIVIAEAGRFPELGRLVYGAGPKIAADRLAEYLQAGQISGTFTRGDAGLRARHFLEMIKGDLHFRALLGLGRMPPAREIDRCVDAAVATFLAGITPRS